MEFLTLHFKRGARYGTLNSYRSAISQIADPSVTNDFRVKRFFKGVYNLRPGKPKYDVTWDPSIVLDLFRNSKNSSLSLQDLSYKLVTLLSLATGQRLQTLSSIEICNIHKGSESIDIKIPKRIKTSGPNKIQPSLNLPFLNSSPNICIANTLLHYLERTSHLRGHDLCNNLLITFKKPHHNASTQTLSRWVKKTLAKSGLDTKVFTAHSTRHAATSAAARAGISLDLIRKTACWSKRSETFAKFYNRPIRKEESFAAAVLG